MPNLNKKIQLLAILIFSAIILSACSLPFARKQSSDDWRNEIAIAKECGIDGFQCCADQDPSCSYGLNCCSDPVNKGATMCAKTCDCGNKNSFCCQGEEKCQEGLACNGGVCRECGDKDEYCCEGERDCNADNLICHNNSCKECGLADNPCCKSGIACLGQDLRDANRTECREKLCLFCGSMDRNICQTEPSCLKGLLPNNGLCITCGELNQPCCVKGQGNGNACEAPLKCDRGFCSD